EPRRSAAQMRRIERPCHLLERQESVLGGRMAESKEVIRHCQRQVATLPVLAHAGRPMALWQWRAVTAHDQRHVTITGCVQSQRLENQELARCVRQMIFAAQDVSHTHVRVIYRIAEEERSSSVGTTHDEISDVIGEKALRTVHEIQKLD